MENRQERIYEVDTLRKYSEKLFNVPVEVFDVALYGVKELTKLEAEIKIKEWLRKEVQ